jgi:hypothetical protein
VIDKAITDYLEYASLLTADLHAEERWQGAALAGNSASEAVQANAFQTYWQQTINLKPLLAHDNVQLAAVLPKVNLATFPGGAAAIATAYNNQCGHPLEASLNGMLLADGFSQAVINQAVCDHVKDIGPTDISVDFRSVLTLPLP